MSVNRCELLGCSPGVTGGQGQSKLLFRKETSRPKGIYSAVPQADTDTCGHVGELSKGAYKLRTPLKPADHACLQGNISLQGCRYTPPDGHDAFIFPICDVTSVHSCGPISRSSSPPCIYDAIQESSLRETLSERDCGSSLGIKIRWSPRRRRLRRWLLGFTPPGREQVRERRERPLGDGQKLKLYSWGGGGGVRSCQHRVFKYSP